MNKFFDDRTLIITTGDEDIVQMWTILDGGFLVNSVDVFLAICTTD